MGTPADAKNELVLDAAATGCGGLGGDGGRDAGFVTGSPKCARGEYFVSAGVRGESAGESSTEAAVRLEVRGGVVSSSRSSRIADLLLAAASLRASSAPLG
jgi:hypothetical protein